jgi:hypothetical protein
LIWSLQLKSSPSWRARPPRSSLSDEHHMTSGSDELFVNPLMTRTSYSSPQKYSGWYIDMKIMPMARLTTRKILVRTFMLWLLRWKYSRRL